MIKREPIFLKQALEILNTRLPDGSFKRCDISIRTFNSQTGKGGKMIFYNNVRLLPEASLNQNKKENKETILKEVKTRKKPNHFKNRTRNVELMDGQVKTIRIDFIININGNYIIY